MAPDRVLDALKAVTDPDLHADIVALKFVKDLSVDGDRAAFTNDVANAVVAIAARYHDESAHGARAHRLVVASYPAPDKTRF